MSMAVENSDLFSLKSKKELVPLTLREYRVGSLLHSCRNGPRLAPFLFYLIKRW